MRPMRRPRGSQRSTPTRRRCPGWCWNTPPGALSRWTRRWWAAGAGVDALGHAADQLEGGHAEGHLLRYPDRLREAPGGINGLAERVELQRVLL